MSTQTFNVYLFDPQHAPKKVLHKTEVRDFCRHYNQHTPELDAFLERFEVDEWVCLGVDIEDVYSKATGDGAMDCNPAELLGILLTSQHNDRIEEAFRSLLQGTSVEFAVDGNVRFPLHETVYDDSGNYTILEEARVFNRTQHCPLWVVQVQQYSTYTVQAIVLLPSQLWDEGSLHNDSAGYGYSIKDRNWYRWDKADGYRAARFGAYSPNFLVATATETTIPYGAFWVDPNTDRLFVPPDKKNTTLTYHDSTQQLQLVKDGPQLEAINKQKPTGIYQKEGHYYISTKKKVLVTDTNFEPVEGIEPSSTLKGSFIQHYLDDHWEVLITGKGIDIRSHKAHKQDKLSAFKIKATEAGMNRLSIHALNANHLVLLNDKWIVVDADLNITVHSLKKSLRKALEPLFGKDFLGVTYPYSALALKDKAPWFVLNQLVLSADENNAPIAMNAFLREKTGEGCFYGAVADPKRQGIWLLAGLERLIFMDEQLEQAFVFNTDPVGSVGGGTYPNPWLQLDAQGNLWFALNSAPIRKIDHAQIDQQLKIAIPHTNK